MGDVNFFRPTYGTYFFLIQMPSDLGPVLSGAGEKQKWMLMMLVMHLNG
jgi:hypothetical protein